MYNLEVRAYHNFFVGDDAVLAHNSYAALKNKVNATFTWLIKFLDNSHPKIRLAYLEADELLNLRSLRSKRQKNLDIDVSSKNTGIMIVKELDADIDSKLFSSISGKDKFGIDVGVEVEYDKNGFFKNKDKDCSWDGGDIGKIPRHADCEKKFLEELVKRLKAKGASKDVKGLVEIHTEFVPCESCTNIIELFHQEYPNINLVVKTHEKGKF